MITQPDIVYVRKRPMRKTLVFFISRQTNAEKKSKRGTAIDASTYLKQFSEGLTAHMSLAQLNQFSALMAYTSTEVAQFLYAIKKVSYLKDSFSTEEE